MTSTPSTATIDYNPETIPVEEAKRLSASEIKIEIAEEEDAYEIVAAPVQTYPPTNL
jgi:hypothetical protein